MVHNPMSSGMPDALYSKYSKLHYHTSELQGKHDALDKEKYSFPVYKKIIVSVFGHPESGYDKFLSSLEKCPDKFSEIKSLKEKNLYRFQFGLNSVPCGSMSIYPYHSTVSDSDAFLIFIDNNPANLSKNISTVQKSVSSIMFAKHYLSSLDRLPVYLVYNILEKEGFLFAENLNEKINKLGLHYFVVNTDNGRGILSAFKNAAYCRARNFVLTKHQNLIAYNIVPSYLPKEIDTEEKWMEYFNKKYADVLEKDKELKTNNALPIFHQTTEEDVLTDKQYEALISNYKNLDSVSLKNIKTRNRKMFDVFDKIEKVAKDDCTVLILGETGTGKELIAKLIHASSLRNKKEIVAINSRSVNETLLESEFFGHEKGSFTDAKERKTGFLELVNGGTLFLDEIGDMSYSLQTKLIRAIEEKKIRPVGSNKEIIVSFRLVCATNKNIEKLISEGKFREDFHYRIREFVVRLPPLRERISDIKILAKYFMEEWCNENHRDILIIPEYEAAKLRNYNWPGNIRELRQVVRNACLLSLSGTLKFENILSVNTNDDEESVKNEKEMLLESLIIEANKISETGRATIQDVFDLAESKMLYPLGKSYKSFQRNFKEKYPRLHAKLKS